MVYYDATTLHLPRIWDWQDAVEHGQRTGGYMGSASDYDRHAAMTPCILLSAFCSVSVFGFTKPELGITKAVGY